MNIQHSYRFMFGMFALLCFLFLIAGRLWTVPPVSAAHVDSRQSTDMKAAECWPLDVVVLIDESLSMSKPDGNDYEGYRYLATREILNLLISNRRGQCPEAVHRLGVIYFTDVVSPVVPLVPINISLTDDRDTWSRDLIKAITQGMPYKLKNGTDPELAFREADKLLYNAASIPQPADYGPRKQVVILLTDGNPEGANIPESSSGLGNYMRNLNTYLSSDRWNSRSIWIVALNAKYLDREAYDRKTMRDVWREVAQSHGGELLGEDEYSEQTIPYALGYIIDKEFAQPGKKIACGDFYVDPYLQTIRFVFSKNLKYQNNFIILSKLDDATGEILLRYVGGKLDYASVASPMKLLENSYRRDGIIEEYNFDLPLPGRWSFTIEGVSVNECRSVVDARVTTRVTDVKLVAPLDPLPQFESPPYYDQESSVPMMLRLETRDGGALPLPDYPLTVTGKLNLPSGKSSLPDGHTLPVYEFVLGEDDVWVGKPAYVVAPEVGTYSVFLEGVSVRGPERKELYTVFTTTLHYEVKKLGRLKFVILTPAQGQTIPCNVFKDKKPVGNSIPVEIMFLDGNGQPADINFYIKSDLNSAFNATLLDSSGTKLTTTYLKPSTRLGIFEGVIDIANIVGCGRSTLKVDFLGSVDQERFAILRKTQSITFNRPPSTGILANVELPKEGGEYRLHRNLWEARKEDIAEPVNLKFTLTDTENRPVHPADIAKGSPQDLYRVVLILPNGEKEQVPLTVAESGAFSAAMGMNFASEGMYRLELWPVQEAFKDGYVSAESVVPVELEFKRFDSLWTKPGTFKIVAGLSGFIIVFSIGLVIYLLTGAPGGTLEVIKDQTDERLCGPFALTRNRFPIWHSKRLLSLGIKKIKVKKVPSLEEGKRAVWVEGYGNDGELLFEGQIESGDYLYTSVSEDFIRIHYEF